MAKFQASSLLNITAATISTAITNGTGALRQQLVVQVVPTGTITNTTINVSAAFTDDAANTVWGAVQTLNFRTLPGGSKVFDLALFDIFSSPTVLVSLETAITGGGNVTLQYAFV